MVERSYSNSELVELIRNSLARRLARHRRGRMEEPGKAADRMLAEGFDIHTAFYALRDALLHSRVGEASPIDRRMDYDARWATIWGRQQRVAEVRNVVEADALATLRAALASAGPFVTIPKLGNVFHIRFSLDNGLEIVTDNGILPGSNVVMQLQPTKRAGGRRATVPQKMIDKLDREACAALIAEGKPLMKKARAGLIQQALVVKGHNLAVGTIENRLKAKAVLTPRKQTKTRN